MAQLSGEYGVHPNQISQWKKKALSGLPDIFSRRRKKKSLENEILQSELYRQIGQLKVELDWLKKICSAHRLTGRKRLKQAILKFRWPGNVSCLEFPGRATTIGLAEKVIIMSF